MMPLHTTALQRVAPTPGRRGPCSWPTICQPDRGTNRLRRRLNPARMTATPTLAALARPWKISAAPAGMSRKGQERWMARYIQMDRSTRLPTADLEAQPAPSMLRARSRSSARRTSVLCALLVLAGGATDAWSQAEDPSAPAAYFARSDDPPPVQPPSWDRWLDRADYAPWWDDENLERWVMQANLGRAQAAINAGDHLAIRMSQARRNCAKAIDWYRRAEELGSDLAAGRLGAVYADDNCPKRDLGVAIEWWRKAVDLGNFDAARLLSRRLSEPGGRHYDPVLALAYAEVAAANPERWHGVDEPPVDPAALAAGLTAAQIAGAREIADTAREAMRARAAGFSPGLLEETLLARDLAESTVRIVAIDDLYECARNLIGN